MTARSCMKTVALAAATLVLAGCTTTVRRHPEFFERRARISTVALVPPDVQVVRVVFTGDNEPLTEVAADVSQRLCRLVAGELRQRGFLVKDDAFKEEKLAEFPEVRFVTTQMQSAFADVDQSMFEVQLMDKSKAENYEATVGPNVVELADYAEADGLVFAKMAAFKKSGGEIAKDVATTVLIAAATLGNVVAVSPTQGASLQIALVDGATGDVLWANTVETSGDFQKGGLEAMVKQLFGGFPQ